MEKFKRSFYSDNLHNYDYDDLIRDELSEEDRDHNIDDRFRDERYGRKRSRRLFSDYEDHDR